ncbi:hypothetical protein Q8F55_008095 [Vanrija albida]|uniref:Barwin domain-containing protein n=1 Tax=Vanrija albida TaxID=181172 RepID=A0ABR3PVN4_9TREE
MLAKTLALFALAASLVAAAPTPDWNGHNGHHHHGHGGHRHGGWRGQQSSEVATATDGGDSSDAQPSPSAWSGNDNGDNSGNATTDASNLAAQPQDSQPQGNSTSDSQAQPSAQPAAQSSAQPNSGAQPSGQTFTGDATYYDVLNPAENEGQSAGTVACSGTKYTNDDAIVAINSAQFPGSCGKKVIIKDDTTGNTAEATAVDECSSCGYGAIDLTPSLWSQLHNGKTDDGIFQATWSFA